MTDIEQTSAEQGSRISAILIGMLPVFAILSLGGYMASSQAKGRNELMQAVPDYESLADMASSANETVLMVSGRLAPLSEAASSAAGGETAGGVAEWLVYHERAEDSRASREEASESLIFPPLRLVLPDGELLIEPVDEERMIHAELHSEVMDGQLRSGFRSGDLVTVQGRWHAAADGQPARLADSTGISGMSKADLLAETEVSARKVTTFSRVTGLLALLGLVALIRSRLSKSVGEPGAAGAEAQRA